MENSSLPADRQVFILRLWRAAPQDLAWRGQILNVRTGRASRVKSLEELINYLHDQMQQCGVSFPEKDSQGGLK